MFEKYGKNLYVIKVRLYNFSKCVFFKQNNTNLAILIKKTENISNLAIILID